jgi:GT2 family glycosyltransferase
MKISAIIVNYFSGIFLSNLLKVLNNEKLILEIFIVNNSLDEDLSIVISHFYKVQLITNEHNIGFGKAVNQAAKVSSGDWLLIINPDTLPDKDCIKKLLAGAEKSNALIAGPRFFWDDNKVFKFPPAIGYSWWSNTAMESASRFNLDAKLLSFYWNIRHERFWKETKPFFEPFLSGALLLIKNDKNYFTDGKIFDERFFLYYEDTDLCAKALTDERIIVCVPDAYAIHYWNQSPHENKSLMMVESLSQFCNKYYQQDMAEFPVANFLPENYVDLGAINYPYNFNFNYVPSNSPVLFEFGVNPFFVPYVQAVVRKSPFTFPKSVWEKLAIGTYFTRIRFANNKTLIIWKWTKQ